jgi:hypothetical protein
MEIMGTAELENEITRRALAGDADAGLEALKLCRTGLDNAVLSPALAHYLAERLSDVIDGIRPDRALCIAKGRGNPAEPFPEWKMQLAAFAGLLRQRGYKPQQIAAAMCNERYKLFRKTLDDSDALKISKLLPDMATDILVHMAGPYRKVLLDYLPVT